MSIELGQKLAALRKKNEITQKQIADILHINRATYAYYERGDTEPDLKTLVRLSRMLGVDPSYFLPDLDSPKAGMAADGGDAEVTKKESSRSSARSGGTYNLDGEEKSLLLVFRSLDSSSREKVISFANGLTEDFAKAKKTQSQ